MGSETVIIKCTNCEYETIKTNYEYDDRCSKCNSLVKVIAQQIGDEDDKRTRM